MLMNARVALVFDWLCFNEKVDSVMNIGLYLSFSMIIFRTCYVIDGS